MQPEGSAGTTVVGGSRAEVSTSWHQVVCVWLSCLLLLFVRDLEASQAQRAGHGAPQAGLNIRRPLDRTSCDEEVPKGLSAAGTSLPAEQYLPGTSRVAGGSGSQPPTESYLPCRNLEYLVAGLTPASSVTHLPGTSPP